MLSAKNVCFNRAGPPNRAREARFRRESNRSGLPTFVCTGDAKNVPRGEARQRDDQRDFWPETDAPELRSRYRTVRMRPVNSRAGAPAARSEGTPR